MTIGRAGQQGHDVGAHPWRANFRRDAIESLSAVREDHQDRILAGRLYDVETLESVNLLHLRHEIGSSFGEHGWVDIVCEVELVHDGMHADGDTRRALTWLQPRRSQAD